MADWVLEMPDTSFRNGRLSFRNGRLLLDNGRLVLEMADYY